MNWLREHKAISITVTVIVLFLLWLLFRPEKLFINHKVNEPPPDLSLNEPVQIGETLLADSLPSFTFGTLRS